MAAPPETDASFGARLRRYRIAAGLTQEALAERAGLSLNAISALERGERRYPYPRTIQVLATALELSETDQRVLVSAVPKRSERLAQPLAPSSAIPQSTLPFFGREQEIDAVVALLRQPETRLVNLTGPGGVGKTRLGQRVAMDLQDAYADGAWFVSLAPIADPALVTTAIVQALGLGSGADASPENVLVHFLSHRELVLVLDNFEQVAAAAPILADILAQCPGVRVIVTSRLALRIDGEREFPVPPLGLPARADDHSIAELAAVPAIALFVQRARAVRPAFTMTPANAGAIAELCARLDGLPLAIELAAARSRVLSPQAMLGRLTDRLALLTGGGPDRPARLQTMRGAIDWSFGHLGPPEQVLFRRLSVFVGGFTLDAAGRVAGERADRASDDVPVATDSLLLDRVESLADHNLLLLGEEADGEVRFGMLETIREYGLEQLGASGEEHDIRNAHAACFLRLVGQARHDIEGPARRVAHARVARELDNVRSALTWLRDDGNVAMAQHLANEMARFWIDLGYISEGRTWASQVVAMPGPVAAGIRAEALYWAAGFANLQNDAEPAGQFASDALSLAQEHGDVLGVARALTQLAWALLPTELERARAMAGEALKLFGDVGDQVMEGMALHQLGSIAVRAGDVDQAVAYHTAALVIWRRLEHPWGVPAALRELAESALSRGDLVTARAQYQESLQRWRSLGERLHISGCLLGLARVTYLAGDHESAVLLLAAQVRLDEEMGYVHAPELLQDLIDNLRVVTGDGRFAELWHCGQTHSMDMVLDDIVAKLGPTESEFAR